MLILDRDAVAAALAYGELVEALAEAFASDFATPVRGHHGVPVPGAADGTLLIMPAWQAGRSLGVKIATVFPDNAREGMPSVNASYLLLDANSGRPLAVLDGAELTLRRTAAASALASRYLSREDSATLLMVGTGSLAPHLVAAHAAVRPLRRILVWGRDPAKARRLAAGLGIPGADVAAAPSLEAAVGAADIVSSATLAREPLIAGAWLRPGQHLDLVGAFTPRMREADDDALRVSRVFVDTRDGALEEAGEIVQGLSSGAITAADIAGELSELARGDVSGRRSAEDITLFKSTGCALEDLVAATLVWDRQARGSAH